MPAPLRIGLAGLGTVGAGVVKVLQVARRDNRRPRRPPGRDRRDLGAIADRDRGVDLSAYAWEDDPVVARPPRGRRPRGRGDRRRGRSGQSHRQAALAGGKHLVTANKAMLARHGSGAGERRRGERRRPALRGGGRRRHPGGQGADRGPRRQRHHPGDGGAERHLQLHPDPDGGRGRALRPGARGGASASAMPRRTRVSTSAAWTRPRSSRCSSPTAFGTRVDVDGMAVEGIERVSLADIEHAAELGYRIKLLGVAQQTAAGLEARMQPCLVRAASPLGQLEGVTNMVVLEGDFVGRIVLSGPGAGEGPTASAIVGDVIDIARGLVMPAFGRPAAALSPPGPCRRRRGRCLLSALPARRRAGHPRQGRGRARRRRHLDQPDAPGRARRPRGAGPDRHPPRRAAPRSTARSPRSPGSASAARPRWRSGSRSCDAGGDRSAPSADADLPAIQAIYAHHVLHGTAYLRGGAARPRRDGAAPPPEIAGRGLPYLVAEAGGRCSATPTPARYRARERLPLHARGLDLSRPRRHRPGHRPPAARPADRRRHRRRRPPDGGGDRRQRQRRLDRPARPRRLPPRRHPAARSASSSAAGSTASMMQRPLGPGDGACRAARLKADRIAADALRRPVARGPGRAPLDAYTARGGPRRAGAAHLFFRLTVRVQGPRSLQARPRSGLPRPARSPRSGSRIAGGPPMSDDRIFADRMLSLGLARVSEAAAIAAAKLVGRGDEKAADQAAVDAMRTQLNMLDIQGVVVIGEGERDEAPMLYIGEEVGTGNGPGVDIALDPLEGTTLTAKDMPNALAVIAMGPRGSMLHAPDVYMDKLAIGPGYPRGPRLARHDPDRADQGAGPRQGHRRRRHHGLRARAPAPRGADRRDPRHRRPHPADHRRRRRRRHPLRRARRRPASTCTWARAAPPRGCWRRRR